MAGPSYLSRFASRATDLAPSIGPPKRVGRVLPVDVSIPAETIAATTITRPSELTPQVTVTAPVITRPQEITSVAEAPRIRREAAATPPAPEQSIQKPAAPSIPAATPKVEPTTPRRHADFTFGRRQVVPETSAPVAARASERVVQPPKRTLEAPRHAPIESPIAAALAAAVRWTSSDDSADAVVPAPKPLHPPRAVAAAPAVPSQTATHPTRAIEPPPLRERFAGPPVESRLPPPTSVAPTPEHFASIRIGSVNVEIAPPPEPRSEAKALKPSSAAPLGPLARGLTSSIGLRQS